MRRRLPLVLGLTLHVSLTCAAVPGLLREDQQWEPVRAFGMQLDYPAGIFAVDQGRATKGPGRQLSSEDGSAGLMFWVEPNENGDTPSSFIRARLKVEGQSIDYQRVTKRFFVVSGVRRGRIYYSRCNFPDRATGPLHCIHLEYNKNEKRPWDAVVTRISLSLR
jgi:hypothetical protein